MRLADFDYFLPKELIAQEPIEPADHSWLMIVNRQNKTFSRHYFYEIKDYLEPKKDILVFNDTKVIPARLIGKKISGGKQEVLLLRSENDFNSELWTENWRVIGSPSLKINQEIIFHQDLKAKVIKIINSERIIAFNQKGEKLKNLIFQIGQIPLPPYIKHPTQKSFKKYQTVYAQKEGSVAAPTAGFHFTENLLNQLKEKGIEMEYLTLHIGLGTFQPVKTKNIKEHKMSEEYFELSPQTAQNLNEAKRKGKRIIAVGTTVCRVLESCSENNKLKPQKGWTNLFIYPGYQFKFIDALITNFHLPKSTLLMLVCAFGGYELILKAYQEAIRQKYRFYSFGDAMFIQ